MSGINFDDWEVNLDRLSATHSTGFTLSVEGSVKNPSAVHPGPFPKHLSALEQVRLLRHGVEAIAREGKRETRVRPAPRVKSAQGVNPNRPKKTLLTLKRKTSVEESH